jgi:hypothetical protein
MPPAIPPAQVSSFALQGTLFLYASLTLYMQFIKLKKYEILLQPNKRCVDSRIGRDIISLIIINS